MGQRWDRVRLVGLLASAGALAAARLSLERRTAAIPPQEPGRHRVRVLETRRIVPSTGLPPEVEAGDSNNNLDAVRHSDGRVYLAFRTAPHHFASPRTVIQIVSSVDEESWRFEGRFHVGSDLREPRLLSLGESLFLYVSRLGKDAFAFEPQGMAFSERRPDGSWTELEPLGPPGTMGWRVRRLGGTPAFFVYSGGADIYSGRRGTLRVGLWRSDDGRRWEPWDARQPCVYEGGGSEADAVLGDDGTLYGVIRNEAGDDSGWGSLVIRAPAGNLASWTCRPDRRKFDSPFMFWHDGEAYLVGRRSLYGDGEYDRGRGPSWLLRTVWNQVNYSFTPKRTALWRYVQGEDRFGFVMDLPSRGDTCFPAVLDGARPRERVVYDYSCDLDGPDLPWIRGQRGRTSIYRHLLEFEEQTSEPGSEPAGGSRGGARRPSSC
jgi:hypothetical protein